MSILLWYFPLIIFSAACDLVFSTRQMQTTANTSEHPLRASQPGQPTR